MMAPVETGESNSPHSPRCSFPNRERKKKKRIESWNFFRIPTANSASRSVNRTTKLSLVLTSLLKIDLHRPLFPVHFPRYLFFFQITCRNSPLLYSKACNIRGAAFPFKVPQVSFHKVKERRTGLYSVCIRRSFPNAQSLYISAGVLRNSVDVAKITRIDDVQAHEILTVYEYL